MKSDVLQFNKRCANTLHYLDEVNKKIAILKFISKKSKADLIKLKKQRKSKNILRYSPPYILSDFEIKIYRMNNYIKSTSSKIRVLSLLRCFLLNNDPFKMEKVSRTKISFKLLLFHAIDIFQCRVSLKNFAKWFIHFVESVISKLKASNDPRDELLLKSYQLDLSLSQFYVFDSRLPGLATILKDMISNNSKNLNLYRKDERFLKSVELI